jgi:hypothetical protein
VGVATLKMEDDEVGAWAAMPVLLLRLRIEIGLESVVRPSPTLLELFVG